MIMSQKNGSPLISNRRKSRLSLSVDPGMSLENNDNLHNHGNGIHETDLSREDNHTCVLARAHHSVSNLNNQNGFSIDLLNGDSAKSAF